MIQPQHPIGAFDMQPGTIVGKYEILRKLATGGMAEIYLARVRGTAGFEKIVVLKRILPNIARDPGFMRMFLDEARLAATLQHTNIADVYDVGEADGTYFFTMEYVHGQDARAIRAATKERNERPPLPIALAIVQGTAAALDYAHDKGVVHRDVSSSNIIVSYDGAVKLVDFGIARASASETKTRTGTLKGKIPYMSPEQCRGMSLDRRTDLFSLGVVLYELTLGRRPFRGESDFDLMEQIVRRDVRRPTELDPGYPPALEAIVLRLLAREREARYQTADELLGDLEPFVQGHQLWASPKSISKFMRALFADKIAAWQVAEQQGVSLAQHVSWTITGSGGSHVLTPPSIVGIPLRESQRDLLPAGPVSAPLPVAPMPETDPSRVVPPSIAFTPELPKRRGLVIASVAIVTVAIGVAGVLVFGNARPATTPSAPEEVKPAVTREEPPPPAPEVARPAGEPAPPTPEVPTTRVVVDPSSPTPEKPAPPTTPDAATKPTPKPTPKPPPQKKPKPSVKKPGTPTRKPPPKEPTWDPDSPFLPPS